MSVPEHLVIRWAQPADVGTMLGFVRELAEYEREPDAVLATEADFLRDGWGLEADGMTPIAPAAPARFRCWIAEGDGVAVGFALFFTSYSTWRGHHGIRLEDLYVTPSMRGRGVGGALLAGLAKLAVDEGCPRLEWDVLEWNMPAIAVYEKLGARILTEWRIMRVHGDELQKLAARAQATV